MRLARLTPSGARQAAHLAVLGGLIAVGVLSAGFVGLSEAQAAQEAAETQKWIALIDTTSLDIAKATELIKSVANRSGPWDASYSADMDKASALYANVARRCGRRDRAGADRVVPRGNGEELPRSRGDHPRIRAPHREITRERVRGARQPLEDPPGRNRGFVGSLRGAGGDRALARDGDQAGSSRTVVGRTDATSIESSELPLRYFLR